jgi:phage terminase Nu1 subunit (DNA packaging protein)
VSLESTNRLSELTGMDVRTIKRRLATLQPTVQGRAHTYESRDALPLLYGAQDSAAFDLNQERARLAHHQANNESLREAQLRGDLLPRGLVIQTWQAIIAAARSRLLALPTKAAHQLLAAKSLSEAEDVVRGYVYEALAELARDGLPAGTGTVGAESLGAAAGPDSEPVGGPVPAPVERKQRRARSVADRSGAVPARGDGRRQRPER